MPVTSSNPDLHLLLRRLGMPENCLKFVLTVELGEPVTIEATYRLDKMPRGDVPLITQFYLTESCDHSHWSFAKHGRRCTCGALMEDWGD